MALAVVGGVVTAADCPRVIAPPAKLPDKKIALLIGSRAKLSAVSAPGASSVADQANVPEGVKLATNTALPVAAVRVPAAVPPVFLLVGVPE